MSKLEGNLDGEIFLVYNDEQNDKGDPVKICVFSEFMELIDCLRKLTPSIDFETKILHGILTKAYSLPKNLRGKAAFIIVNDIYNPDHALIIESGAQSDKDLASIIDSMLVYDGPDSIAPLGIESIYILYGYEISTILSLDEEEIDEEIIDTCQEIANDAKIIELLTND